MQPPLNEDTIYIHEAEEEPDFFAESKSLFQSYLNERIALLKLQVAEKVSVTAGAIVMGVVLAVLGLFLLLFISITLGFLLSNWLGSRAVGFGIVTGIYLLLVLIVAFFGKQVFGNAITQKMIQSFFKKK